MARPKTGDKRAAILRAATKTIAEDGVGASTASIAKAAAVAEGSLFRYFPDKDKLLNELYRELKLDMRSAMIAGFPLTGSLRKRIQHIWNSYVTWGMESPAKCRAMMQLTVSERITDQSRQEGLAGFEDNTKAMEQLVAQGKLSGLPPAFASDLLLVMAETTMASMVANPAKAEHYRSAGFEAFWSAAAKKLVPPFTRETAILKVRKAEDGWNSRNPQQVSLAYTPDSVWRNRAEFIQGRDEIMRLLTRKWQRELDYRLIKELWAYDGNRIAVRFAYEFHDDSGQWYRAYGNENWEFNAEGIMHHRHASINDVRISEADRLFHWPLGRRPDDYPGLSDLNL